MTGDLHVKINYYLDWNIPIGGTPLVKFWISRNDFYYIKLPTQTFGKTLPCLHAIHSLQLAWLYHLAHMGSYDLIHLALPDSLWCYHSAVGWIYMEVFDHQLCHSCIQTCCQDILQWDKHNWVGLVGKANPFLTSTWYWHVPWMISAVRMHLSKVATTALS